MAQTGSPLLQPAALAYDTAGNLFIADANRHQVFEATLAGTLLVVAGTGVQGFAGDGGPGPAAELNSPQGLAFGTDGTLYIADTGNARIRALHGGTLTTFAGTGAHSFAGDGTAATAASFRTPAALAVAGDGSLLVCDPADHRIRRVSQTGFEIVSTFAGTGVQGFAGDGGTATQAELDTPSALAVGTDGRVFIADTHNQRVRAVATDGTITTILGTGQRGFAGDGGPASATLLAGPRGLAALPDGTLLVADTDNQRVRSLSRTGLITTLAGAGGEGASSDGNPALAAPLRNPRDLAVSGFGMTVFGDALNHTVRVLTPNGALYQPAALASPRVSAVGVVLPANPVYGTGTGAFTVQGIVGVPQGTVTLDEGGFAVASGALQRGVANIGLSGLNAGVHTLTAVYGGDGLNPAATVAFASVTVIPAPLTAVAQAETVPYGAVLPALSGTLAGVLPQDAGQVSAVFSPISGGTLSVGTYPILAILTGPKAGNYTVSTAANSGLLKITQAASNTTLRSPGTSFAGVPLPLSANVSAATSGQPSGRVEFVDGANVVATATLVNGSASALYAMPPAGSLSLSAHYVGDTDFTASTSAPQVALLGAMPDFNLTAQGAATASVAAGTTAMYTLLVNAQPAPFTGGITLSATGLPAGATVTFSPVEVVPGTGSATVTVSVLTPAPQAALRHGSATLACAGLAIGAALLTRRRKRWLYLLGVGVLASGCGARTVGELGNGLAAQTYTVQITGTSTNLLGAVVTHSTSVTLTVQN